MTLTTFRSAILRAAMAVFALAVAAAPAVAGPSSDVVETFHRTLLDVMKHADELKLKGRYDRLTSPMDSTFNMPVMMQIASGGTWRTATDAEKAKLIDAFRRVSVGTYAARFDGYSGEKFETLGEQNGPGGSRLVSTRIVRPDKDPVPLTYVTRKFGDAWRVVDVIVSGGISELAVRRSEYNAILKDGGPSELIARLNQIADQILAN